MTWVAKQIPREQVTPLMLFNISKEHGLILHRIDVSIERCKGLASRSTVVQIVDDEDDADVGYLIVDKGSGDTAAVDLVPQARLLASRDRRDELGSIIRSVMADVMKGDGCRRATAMVPASRFRTKKALTSAGFVYEGRLREGVRFAGADPEDLITLGLLRSDLEGE